ncbi:MAG: protein kinase domain-containing protein [Nannocystales bacterium]
MSQHPFPSDACVDPSVLAAWCSDRLDTARRHGVERHIDGCDECAELMAAAGRVCATATHSRVEVSVSELLGEDLAIMRELLNAQLGPYRLHSVIGGGGLGLVFEARDTRLGRRVAIKALRRADTKSGGIRREAQALASISHPAVVEVFDVLARGEREYLVMEYVEGQTLRTWQHGRSAAQVLEAYRTVSRGLAAVHAAGLVHCDVKPDNVLVAHDGRVLVADFGLALLADSAGNAGKAPGGTPCYMPPEQRGGDSVSFASDQYAFATSVWEALTGQLPPHGGDRLAAAVRRALKRALLPRPEARWSSLAALHNAMQGTTKRRWVLPLVGLGLAAALATTAAAASREPIDVLVAAVESRFVGLDPSLEVAKTIASAEQARKQGDLRGACALLQTGAQNEALRSSARAQLGLRWSKMLDTAGERTEAARVLTALEHDASQTPDRLQADIALELARTRPVAAQSDTAEDWLRIARARLERAGVDPNDHVEARRVASDVLRARGDREAALTEIDAALALDRPQMPPMRRASLLQDRAHLLDRLARYDEAEDALDQGMALLETHGLERTDVAMLLTLTRGNMEWFQGHKRSAIRTLDRAITLGESLQGGSPVDLARALNDLGTYAMELGDFERARKALERAHAALPDYYVVTANLAIYYGRVPCVDAEDPAACKEENEARASEYQFRAYETAREELPPGHPSLAQMAGNLAFGYSQRGRLDEALELYDEALEGLTVAYGERHIKLMRPLLGALEVAVRTRNEVSARRLAERTRETADTNRKTLGDAALAVVDYALIKTNAWISDTLPADPQELEDALAFFEGKPPQDVGMVDAWFSDTPAQSVPPPA